MHIIETERLRLQLVPLTLFDLCLAGARHEAERLATVTIADDWMLDKRYLRMRRDQLAAGPSYAPWCTRMIVLKSTNRMIGQIGFHAPPDSPELRATAPGGVEFGYRIYEEFRRQGYAREASVAIMRWAANEKNIEKFVVSIAPGNAPSQALAKSIGFVKVGEQMDEVDGLEDVLLLEGEALALVLSI